METSSVGSFGTAIFVRMYGEISGKINKKLSVLQKRDRDRSHGTYCESLISMYEGDGHM